MLCLNAGKEEPRKGMVRAVSVNVFSVTKVNIVVSVLAQWLTVRPDNCGTLVQQLVHDTSSGESLVCLMRRCL